MTQAELDQAYAELSAQRHPARSIPVGAQSLPCGCYTERDDVKGPVYWNTFNKAVQCHKCGTVYAPNLA